VPCLNISTSPSVFSAAEASSPDAAVASDRPSSILAEAVIAPLPFVSVGVACLDSTNTPEVGAFSGMTPRVAAGVNSGPGRLVGAMAAVDLGPIALHGWAASPVEGAGALPGSIEELRGQLEAGLPPRQWGITIGSMPGDTAARWSLSAGRVSALGPLSGEWHEPNLVEASVQLNMGGGLFVTPGLVIMRQEEGVTSLAGVKASWFF
jgi:hypothetical protein